MSTETTRAVIAEYDRLLKARDADGLAALFAEEVDWEIPGDLATVPWIGKRSTRAQVRAFYAEDVPKYLTPDRFDVDATLVDGEVAVRTGDLRSQVQATGKWIESRFVQEFTVRDGRITRYFMHEDSWLVAQAVKP
jgi:ketosteroid isomerase-like protein